MLGELLRLRFYKESNPNELSTQQFKNLEKEIRSPRCNLMSDEYVDFQLWQGGLPSRQESFAKYVEKRIPKKDGIKILEVGCGRTGRVSRILGEKGFFITGIDPKIERKSNENIKFIKGKFNYTKFDVLEYDFVIAQEPCDATEHVVRACITKRVPFIMSLCGVPHELISGYMPRNVTEWYEYLLNISREDLRLRYIELDPLTLTPMLRSNF